MDPSFRTVMSAIAAVASRACPASSSDLASAASWVRKASFSIGSPDLPLAVILCHRDSSSALTSIRVKSPLLLRASTSAGVLIESTTASSPSRISSSISARTPAPPFLRSSLPPSISASLVVSIPCSLSHVRIESEHDTLVSPLSENQLTSVDFPEAFLPVRPTSMPLAGGSLAYRLPRGIGCQKTKGTNNASAARGLIAWREEPPSPPTRSRGGGGRSTSSTSRPTLG